MFNNPVRDGGEEKPTSLTRGKSLNRMACPSEQWADHFVETADGRDLLFTALGSGAPEIVVARITGLDTIQCLDGGWLRWTGEPTLVGAHQHRWSSSMSPGRR